MKSIIIIVIALVLFIPLFVFAQEATMSVQTDDGHYDEGDNIVISGKVSNIIGSTSMNLQIFFKDSEFPYKNSLVDIAQITIAQDGSYSHTITPENSGWEQKGEYTVKASYGVQIAETKFNYIPKLELNKITSIFEVDVGKYGTFDVKYTIQGGTVYDMIINSNNIALELQLDANDDGTITLHLPTDLIRAEKENGKNESFIVLRDGVQTSYREKLSAPSSRVLTIDFRPDDSNIEIIGTNLFNYQEISISTDKKYYTHNDIILVNGKISKIYGFPVTITVVSPLNSIVTIDKLTVANDGSFATTLNTAGNMWKYDGIYSIKTNYGSTETNSAKVVLSGGVEYTPRITANKILLQDLSFIESSDFRTLAFNALPGENGNNPSIQMSVGDKVVFNVDNAGRSFHSFGVTSNDEGFSGIVPGSDIGTASNPLKPGEGGTSEFIAGEEGIFYYICTVPGHREQGMVGQIIVGDVTAQVMEPKVVKEVLESSPNDKKISDLKKEIIHLKLENRNLKQQIGNLQNEIEELKDLLVNGLKEIYNWKSNNS